MKVTTGTAYFPSFLHAEAYYAAEYGRILNFKEVEKMVETKISCGEIHIGNPPLKENQEKKLIDNRWHICE
jgi:hypothetical protein